MSKTYRVLDHELQSTDEYTLVVHGDGPKHDGEYGLSLTKLPKDGCFSINPNDPEGYLIKSDCILPEKCIERWMAGALGGIAVVTPYMTASAAAMIHSGLVTIGRILDFRGRKRTRMLANYYHNQRIEAKTPAR